MELKIDMNVINKMLETFTEMNNQICNSNYKRHGIYEKYTPEENAHSFLVELLDKLIAPKDIVYIIVSYCKNVFGIWLYKTSYIGKNIGSNNILMEIEDLNIYLHGEMDNIIHILFNRTKFGNRWNDIRQKVLDIEKEELYAREAWLKSSSSEYNIRGKYVCFQQTSVRLTDLKQTICEIECYIKDMEVVDYTCYNGYTSCGWIETNQGDYMKREIKNILHTNMKMKEKNRELYFGKDYFNDNENYLVNTNYENIVTPNGLVEINYLMILDIEETKEFVRQLRIVDKVYSKYTSK